MAVEVTTHRGGGFLGFASALPAPAFGLARARGGAAGEPLHAAVHRFGRITWTGMAGNVPNGNRDALPAFPESG